MALPEIDVLLQPTGLFAEDGAFPMSEGFAAHAWAADQRIAVLSGQTFSEAYRAQVLGDLKSRIDSGPATLALTAVRLTAPEREFAALQAIQHARYVDGRDNGRPEVITGVLNALGLHRAMRRFENPDEELRASHRKHLDAGHTLMRRLGARGVPALTVDHGQGLRLIGADALFGRVETLLDQIISR